MKGLPEHEEKLGELVKRPEPPKAKEEGWVTTKPGIQTNDKGQMRTNRDFLERRKP